jgi:hypothetical protein
MGEWRLFAFFALAILTFASSAPSRAYGVPRAARADECIYSIDNRERCGSALSSATDHEYCIIGAGAAGMQLGLFLQRAHRDYVIIERNATAAAFFQRYPRHRKLISINKKYTGALTTLHMQV